MPAIVRIGDQSAGHCFEPRPNLEGSPNVFVNGKAVHRVGDQWAPHTCGNSTHGAVQSQGSPNVFVNGKAVARIGDQQTCGDICAEGSPNVFVN
jgi:uncharacterized Zn-binding protein involved in type VI secretion